MQSTHEMSSSWRVCSLSETLQEARSISKSLGISRVTDVTWLDRIGIPVYSSIRPDAVKGSLCVNAGKGLRQEEAKVGAYMEAIEFATAEFRRSIQNIFFSTPRDICAQKNANFDFMDLCPIYGANIIPDEKIQVVAATEVTTGHEILVPAELVFSPYEEIKGQAIFGTSTNGLCSGNSIREALLHGLSEVIERDVQALNYIKDTSSLVNLANLPDDVNILIEKIKRANLDVVLRFTKNVFELPYFQGYIIEKSFGPIAVSHGTGLHPSPVVAAVRALSEAAQSRLSYIHGGRDDLTFRSDYFNQFEPAYERKQTQALIDKVKNYGEILQFSDLRGVQVSADIESGINLLLSKLHLNGVNQVLQVTLSPHNSKLKVLKVIVPKLESFNPSLKRVGPRLINYFRNLDHYIHE